MNSTIAPEISSRVPARRGTVGISRNAAAMIITPNGTLTKNTVRQPRPARSSVTRRPPSRNPAAPGEPQHDAVNAESAAPRVVGKQEMNGGEHLRHHQRRGGALRQPRHNEFWTGLRQPAPQRGQRETEHTGDEHVPVP